jgi:CO/xanthine dehydrogenase FAD-binding subunit
MNFNVITPHNEAELLAAVRDHSDHFRFGAGYTDLIPEIKKQDPEALSVINLAQLKDDNFTVLSHETDDLIIGALVTAASLEHDAFIKSTFPVLHQAAATLASAQIRQVATVGGNICTASPSGDMACALVALQAQCEILNAQGETRVIPIRDFLTGPRKTVMQKNELLRRVIVPVDRNQTGIHSGFIKVGTRRSMECSVVSIAYHIPYDADGMIYNPGIAIGAAAPTIRFTETACSFLTGQVIHDLNEASKEAFSQKVLEYASPISDIRASAWYRLEVLKNLSKGLFDIF